MKVWEPRKPLTSVRSTWYDTLAMLAAVLLLLPGAAALASIIVAELVVLVVAALLDAVVVVPVVVVAVHYGVPMLLHEIIFFVFRNHIEHRNAFSRKDISSS